VSSAVEHFAVEYIDDGFAVTIRAVGELDMAAAGLLSAEFDRAMESSAGDVTVNLSAVTFMDSTGLSALLRAHAALGALDRRLVVHAPAPAATRTFELTGLQDTFRLASEPG
jgi:anti-sigma B factor antagonist